MTELAALIFDFDGTIADSESLHLAAFQRTLSEGLGLALTAGEYAERYLAFDDRKMLETFLGDRGVEVAPERFERLLAAKAARYQALAEDLPLLPGATEMIRAAARRWPLAVASGALEREVRPVLERAGLAGCFAAVVTAEMVSRGKPDPEVFRGALEGINRRGAAGAGPPGRPIPPGACLVVEDAVAGVAAARAAGMRVLAVTTSYPRERLAEADRVVDSLEETADVEALAAWFAGLPPRG